MTLPIIPKKSLGQNFLVNPRVLDKIVAAAEITKDDIVLEVGPGTGNLTKKLAEKTGRVIAIEKDRQLIGFLKNKLSENSAIAEKSEIIEGDVLKINFSDLKIKEDYKIVANIPYYITSRFLRKIFTEWPRPKLIVLIIQKEVAQRIMASPPHSKLSVGASRPHMNLLALSVQFFAEPKIINYVSKNNFRPRPKVDSAIIKLTPKPKFYILNSKFFFNIVRAGFSQKRKLLISNLVAKLKIKKEDAVKIFAKFGIDEKSRAENLDLDDWIKLAKIIKM